jgi:hypothetical protein
MNVNQTHQDIIFQYTYGSSTLKTIPHNCKNFIQLFFSYLSDIGHMLATQSKQNNS